MAPLPALPHASQDEYLATLRTAVTAREAELSRSARAAGRSVLGRRQVLLRQSAFDSPRGSEPRRQPSPRVAGGNKWARIEALARLRSFLAGYRDAWLQWRAGDRGVVFPFGTYALRVYAGVCCAQAP
jgi:putative transposase